VPGSGLVCHTIDPRLFPEHMPPQTSIENLRCYEELVDAEDGTFEWPQFDQNTASSICYTSGTTGHPKGAVYSHRSTLLHAYGSALPDGMGCSGQDVILPVVSVPDDVVFVAEIPHTATGKMQKLKLRDQFKDHRLPGT